VLAWLRFKKILMTHLKGKGKVEEEELRKTILMNEGLGFKET
jgi:hypothetical protein